MREVIAINYLIRIMMKTAVGSLCLYALPALSACTARQQIALLPRLAPINSARVLQTERVVQELDFGSLPPEDVARILIWTLGETSPKKAVIHLIGIEPADDADAIQILFESAKNNLKTVGHLVFTLYLDPTDLNTFFVDGWGRYVLLITNPKNGETSISAGADFYFESEKQPIEGARVVKAYLRQFVMTSGVAPASRDDMRIRYDINIESLAAGVFRIKDGLHQVSITLPHEQERTIGSIRFDSRYHSDKLLDARCIPILMDDYKEMMPR